MAKYRVHLVTTASTFVEVEADNPEDTADKALESDLPWLCHQCDSQSASDGETLELGDTWEVDSFNGEDSIEEI